jgi:potassium efflux system protein
MQLPDPPATAAAAAGTFGRLMNEPLFTISRTPVTLLTLVTFVAVVLFTLWLSRLAQRGTTRVFQRRGLVAEGAGSLAARLAGYGVLLLGLGVALQTVGVNLGALFAAGAFFAVALGFAMQSVAQNFVAGITLLTEGTIKPGDVLEVEGRTVRVRDMGLRATVARTLDEEDLIIPNSTLVQNTVTNFTLRDPVYRLRTTVRVAFSSDMRQVMTVLREATAGFPARAQEFEPRVLLREFEESGARFEVSVWVTDPWRAQTLRSDLNEAIWWALKRADITIPFPQRDVRVVMASADGKAPHVEAARAIDGADLDPRLS